MKRDQTPATGESLDSLFDGRIQLYQSRAGYRFSLDAVLLAHFVTIQARDKIVDLGAGNGAISLMLAFLAPSARVVGLEIQPAMIERARRSVVLNGLTARVSMRCGDVRALATLGEGKSFDVVVCNPPYRSPLSGRVSPNSEKRIARHEFEGALGDFLRAGSFLLRRRGRLALIYPAFRCVDVLASMRAAGIEPKRLRMVHSFYASEASLILAEGVKGGRSEIVVQAPLIVYGEPRHYSAEVAAMLGGNLAETK
jgi:tRNA1Val (adenine37-N6)-methyltransferase